MTKDQYNTVQSIFQQLLEVPEAKRLNKLSELSSDPEIIKEVKSLLEYNNDSTLLSNNKHSHPLVATNKTKEKHWYSFVFTSTNVFRSTLAIALGLLLILGIWTHNYVRESLLDVRHAELSRTINSLELSLDIWIKDYKHDVQSFSRDPEVKQAIADYLENPDFKPDIVNLFESDLDLNRYSGYAIVTLDGMVILTSDTTRKPFPLPNNSGEAITSVIRGETRFGPPIFLSEWNRADSNSIPKQNVWVSHTIVNSEGIPIAIVSLARAAKKEFSHLLSVTHMGASGESYAVDPNGMLLTNSRFQKQVLELGSEHFSEGDSIYNFFVRDPGVSLKNHKPEEPKELWALTKPAQAIQTYAFLNEKKLGLIKEPYRDYRGEEVIGAWLWFPEYRFGVITEIDKNEAYSILPVITTSFIIVGIVLGGFFILSMFSTLKIVRLSEKMNRDKFGSYIIQKQIGEGGMSNVYLAGHELLQRPTALKVIKPEALNEVSESRFKAEAKQISRLRNPHTIELYDYGVTEQGTIYYAMEYLDGINLKELVKLTGELPVNRTIKILLDVCYSLKEAHDLNLIHRDIKPQNVMVCVLGGIYDMVKVLDFGLVKDLEHDNGEELTKQTDITGTPIYMAPERITTPTKTDTRCDIYALGALAFYMLTAKPLYNYKNDLDVMYQIINTVPENVNSLRNEVPEILSNLISACLEKDPDDRPESVDFLIQVLKQLAIELPYSEEEAMSWWKKFEG
jgi:serine/threonine protein kinase